MNRKQKTWLAFSLIPQVLLVKLLASQPGWVENYYSEGIYPSLAQFLRFLFGWIPFSVGDIFYTLLVFGVVRYLYLYGKTIWKIPKKVLLDLGCVLSIAYFIFHLSWGMNYYRLPINEKMNFEVEYTKEDLLNFTFKMVETTNRLHIQLERDREKPVELPYDTKEIYDKTLESYKWAAKVFPNFEYRTPSLKSSLYSLPLTYMGYGGYVNPFTNEAQVNKMVPAVRLPSISGHEVGHQIGYASEDATNFIGLLVTSANPDPYFQYAAQSHGLAYCLSDLRRKDEKAFKVAFEKLRPGVRENYAQLNRFWRRYENPTEPIFKSMFNAFLKANNQERGIESYNAVVGLLIGFDKASQ
ncbi:MAG: DUF3810 domain-containing protein [Bacteroidota bacterium]